jgi:hypothetical protein
MRKSLINSITYQNQNAYPSRITFSNQNQNADSNQDTYAHFNTYPRINAERDTFAQRLSIT